MGGILTIGGSYLLIALIVEDTNYLLKLSNILYIAEGITFGIVTSLVGGMYPAWKASQMKPLDALRHE